MGHSSFQKKKQLLAERIEYDQVEMEVREQKLNAETEKRNAEAEVLKLKRNAEAEE